MTGSLDDLADRLAVEVAAVPGVDAVYARHGLAAVALDAIARATGVAATDPVVAVTDRDGTLHVETTIGVAEERGASATAAAVRERIRAVVAADRPGPAHVVVRVATIG